MLRAINQQVRVNSRSVDEHTRLRVCLNDVNVLMLIVHNDDGAAISCPINFLEMDASGALWCFSGRPAFAQHCAATLTFTDAAYATHVSLTGLCEIDPDRTHGDRLKSARPTSALFERSHLPHRAVLRFVPETAEYSDASRKRLRKGNPAISSLPAARPVIHDLRRFNQSVRQVA